MDAHPRESGGLFAIPGATADVVSLQADGLPRLGDVVASPAHSTSSSDQDLALWEDARGAHGRDLLPTPGPPANCRQEEVLASAAEGTSVGTEATPVRHGRWRRPGSTGPRADVAREGEGLGVVENLPPTQLDTQHTETFELEADGLPRVSDVLRSPSSAGAEPYTVESFSFLERCWGGGGVGQDDDVHIPGDEDSSVGGPSSTLTPPVAPPPFAVPPISFAGGVGAPPAYDPHDIAARMWHEKQNLRDRDQVFHRPHGLPFVARPGAPIERPPPYGDDTQQGAHGGTRPKVPRLDMSVVKQQQQQMLELQEQQLKQQQQQTQQQPQHQQQQLRRQQQQQLQQQQQPGTNSSSLEVSQGSSSISQGSLPPMGLRDGHYKFNFPVDISPTLVPLSEPHTQQPVGEPLQRLDTTILPDRDASSAHPKAPPATCSEAANLGVRATVAKLGVQLGPKPSREVDSGGMEAVAAAVATAAAASEAAASRIGHGRQSSALSMFGQADATFRPEPGTSGPLPPPVLAREASKPGVEDVIAWGAVAAAEAVAAAAFLGDEAAMAASKVGAGSPIPRPPRTSTGQLSPLSFREPIHLTPEASSTPAAVATTSAAGQIPPVIPASANCGAPISARSSETTAGQASSDGGPSTRDPAHVLGPPGDVAQPARTTTTNPGPTTPVGACTSASDAEFSTCTGQGVTTSGQRPWWIPSPFASTDLQPPLARPTQPAAELGASAVPTQDVTLTAGAAPGSGTYSNMAGQASIETSGPLGHPITMGLLPPIPEEDPAQEDIQIDRVPPAAHSSTPAATANFAATAGAMAPPLMSVAPLPAVSCGRFVPATPASWGGSVDGGGLSSGHESSQPARSEGRMLPPNPPLATQLAPTPAAMSTEGGVDATAGDGRIAVTCAPAPPPPFALPSVTFPRDAFSADSVVRPSAATSGVVGFATSNPTSALVREAFSADSVVRPGAATSGAAGFATSHPASAPIREAFFADSVVRPAAATSGEALGPPPATDGRMPPPAANRTSVPVLGGAIAALAQQPVTASSGPLQSATQLHQPIGIGPMQSAAQSHQAFSVGGPMPPVRHAPSHMFGACGSMQGPSSWGSWSSDFGVATSMAVPPPPPGICQAQASWGHVPHSLIGETRGGVANVMNQSHVRGNGYGHHVAFAAPAAGVFGGYSEGRLPPRACAVPPNISPQSGDPARVPRPNAVEPEDDGANRGAHTAHMGDQAAPKHPGAPHVLGGDGRDENRPSVTHVDPTHSATARPPEPAPVVPVISEGRLPPPLSPRRRIPAHTQDDSDAEEVPGGESQNGSAASIEDSSSERPGDFSQASLMGGHEGEVPGGEAHNGFAHSTVDSSSERPGDFSQASQKDGEASLPPPVSPPAGDRVPSADSGKVLVTPHPKGKDAIVDKEVSPVAPFSDGGGHELVPTPESVPAMVEQGQQTTPTKLAMVPRRPQKRTAGDALRPPPREGSFVLVPVDVEKFGVGVRRMRPPRHLIPPLRHWRNERVLYERLPHSPMPTVRGVVLAKQNLPIESFLPPPLPLASSPSTSTKSSAEMASPPLSDIIISTPAPKRRKAVTASSVPIAVVPTSTAVVASRPPAAETEPTPARPASVSRRRSSGRFVRHAGGAGRAAGPRRRALGRGAIPAGPGPERQFEPVVIGNAEKENKRRSRSSSADRGPHRGSIVLPDPGSSGPPSLVMEPQGAEHWPTLPRQSTGGGAPPEKRKRVVPSDRRLRSHSSSVPGAQMTDEEQRSNGSSPSQSCDAADAAKPVALGPSRSSAKRPAVRDRPLGARGSRPSVNSASSSSSTSRRAASVAVAKPAHGSRAPRAVAPSGLFNQVPIAEGSQLPCEIRVGLDDGCWMCCDIRIPARSFNTPERLAPGKSILVQVCDAEENALTLSLDGHDWMLNSGSLLVVRQDSEYSFRNDSDTEYARLKMVLVSMQVAPGVDVS